jgi:hypothetical protein
MKPEILLKAYVQYQSEDAFRELVGSTLDEVYSVALRIVQGSQHLAEETVLRVYWELARQAPRLGEDVLLASWLREHTCKTAVMVLREEDRSVDRRALKKERQALSTSDGVQVAPPGLATRICQGIFLNAARYKGFRLFLPVWGPAWFRRAGIGAAGLCALIVTIVLWNIPFHRRNPIVQSPELQMTPASFAQLANPEEGGISAEPAHPANTNAQTNRSQQ